MNGWIEECTGSAAFDGRSEVRVRVVLEGLEEEVVQRREV